MPPEKKGAKTKGLHSLFTLITLRRRQNLTRKEYFSIVRYRFDSQFQEMDAVEVVDVSRTVVGVCETEPMVTGGKVNPTGPLLSERVPDVDVSVQIPEELLFPSGDLEI